LEIKVVKKVEIELKMMNVMRKHFLVKKQPSLKIQMLKAN